jgi:hypothetical protein
MLLDLVLLALQLLLEVKDFNVLLVLLVLLLDGVGLPRVKLVVECLHL